MKEIIVGRIKSVKFTLIGLWRLMSKEHSFQVQMSLGILLTIAGFYYEISTTEWMFQVFGIGLILITEGLNTAIEEVCNFMHPEIHKHIAEIKDIAAGAVLISAITGLIVVGIIYLPKILA